MDDPAEDDRPDGVVTWAKTASRRPGRRTKDSMSLLGRHDTTKNAQDGLQPDSGSPATELEVTPEEIARR